MKTYTLKTLLGGALLASLLAVTPVSSFAADVKATSTASVRINNDGIIRVLGAEVTSISGNIINAVTRFKNNVLSWSFTTNASTTVRTGGQATTSIAGIRVGDTLAVNGTATSLGSVINVQATSIKDLTQLASWRLKTGTVQSVNTANGTFVLKANDKLMTVTTNSSTVFKLGNGTTTNSLANVAVGSKIMVYGVVNSDNTAITASSVISKSGWDKKDQVKKDKKNPHNNGKGRDDYIHSLKTNFGLQFGLR